MKKKGLTKNGYSVEECASWLQKAIRRNMEEDALWVAEELFESGFQHYLLYRLWVITFEDIGPANMQLVSLVASQYSTWLQHRDHVGEEFERKEVNRVFNGFLVTQLCRSPKCRLADDSTQYILQKKEEGFVPDFNELLVHDMHTSEGRKKGRGLRHWAEIGSVCRNLAEEGTGENSYRKHVRNNNIGKADSIGEQKYD